MPPGTHVASLPARLAESQVDYIDDGPIDDVAQNRGVLRHESSAIDHAEQLIVIDQCPLAPELAERLLARKRQRPNIKIVLVSDPRNAVYGGTPAQTLRELETSGIIVARTRLERLRDSNPLYSSLWRLTVGWWSDPFDEVSGEITLSSSLRRLNFRSNDRQLLAADDGAGGWSSIVSSAAVRGHGVASRNAALEIHGHWARDIVASELQIAAWSTDDDRLPAPPPVESRSMGTIDARFLTEGAIHVALRDAIAAAGPGDSISVAVHAMGDRQMVASLLRAAARGAALRLLLDADSPANPAVAAELIRAAGGNIDVHWRSSEDGVRLVMIRHRNDVWLTLGSADITRRDLDDLDLEANIELHLPARAAPARAAADRFARDWAAAAAYAAHADESTSLYWRYRVAEATGLAMF